MSAEGYGQPLLLDWSAYTRYLLAAQHGSGDGRLEAGDLARFEAAVELGELVVSHPFRVEALYSEQSPAAFARRSAILDAFSQADAVPDVMETAALAQAQLAASKKVSHRVKFPDLMIAVIADRCGLGVLHFDRDYDTIAGYTDLAFTSRWIAERGSIN